MDLGWLLDRFWMDLGPKLGVKLGASWHTNQMQWGTKTMSTKHQKSRDASVRKWYAVVREIWSWPLKNPSGIL